MGGGAAFDEPDEMRDPWQVRIRHFHHFQGVKIKSGKSNVGFCGNELCFMAS